MKLAFYISILATVLSLSGSANDDIRRYLAGRALYQSQCVFCHGERGRGDGPWAADLTENRPRDFRRGVFKFKTTPLGSMPTKEDLKRTIRSGVAGTSMPAFVKLTDRDLESVVAYIQSFSRRWEDPELVADPLTIPEAPDWLDEPAVRETHAEAGGDLFKTYCASCHGDQGQGNGPASKGLMDAWGHRIQPADLTQPHKKSGASPGDLYRTIALGLDGTPMVGFREALSEKQIWEIVAFIEEISDRG